MTKKNQNIVNENQNILNGINIGHAPEPLFEFFEDLELKSESESESEYETESESETESETESEYDESESEEETNTEFKPKRIPSKPLAIPAKSNEDTLAK